MDYHRPIRKTWTVTRWIKEEYTGIGDTREEAIEYVNEGGNPYNVTCTKQTCIEY